jgi:hypothetical protein
MDGLTRSQLAQRANVNLETIRFYEEIRIAPGGTQDGFRLPKVFRGNDRKTGF